MAATAWARREALRINALSDEELVTEVHYAMNGDNYSWQSINQRMRELEIDHNLYCEWNIICDKKRDLGNADEYNRPFQAGAVLANLSKRNLSKRRDILINMKIIPISAGLGIEAIPLVTTNVDGSSEFTLRDLWIDSEKWKLNYLDRRWEEENSVDEEQPLLGLGRNSRRDRDGDILRRGSCNRTGSGFRKPCRSCLRVRSCLRQRLSGEDE